MYRFNLQRRAGRLHVVKLCWVQNTERSRWRRRRLRSFMSCRSFEFYWLLSEILNSFKSSNFLALRCLMFRNPWNLKCEWVLWLARNQISSSIFVRSNWKENFVWDPLGKANKESWRKQTSEENKQTQHERFGCFVFNKNFVSRKFFRLWFKWRLKNLRSRYTWLFVE